MLFIGTNFSQQNYKIAALLCHKIDLKSTFVVHSGTLTGFLDNYK